VGTVIIDWREFFPEADCVKAGDPFWTTISQYDDCITDHRYNYEWLGLTQEAGAATADRLELEQRNFELQTLFRWWFLEAQS
jgi:hypothetical protein